MLINFGTHIFNVPQISQYESIRWAKDQECICGKSGFKNENKQIIMGFCETAHGFMPVFQCAECFELYRYHISTTGRYNISEFKDDLGLFIFLRMETCQTEIKNSV